ncbi:MAG: adenine deaminase C-terminal domain-containing protein, partial [Clostridiales bacterium]|nr:adenine deaminase C-terminal domain-containing protein [Clostridiales bacterium]
MKDIQIKRIGGGLAISSNNEILDSLSLPIAGLMSDKDINFVSEKLDSMLEVAYEQLSVSKDIEPFMTLAFLALPVIPHIKITDKGLFDVDKFEFI